VLGGCLLIEQPHIIITDIPHTTGITEEVCEFLTGNAEIEAAMLRLVA
jgi:hypothetical protein